MHLELDTSSVRYRITGYTATSVTVNTIQYRHSLIVMPEDIKMWNVTCPTELTNAHLLELLAMQPQVVLLGTGEHSYFPDAALWMPLYQAGIGVEVMTTPAACRTFNLLAAEGRSVAAALIIK